MLARSRVLLLASLTLVGTVAFAQTSSTSTTSTTTSTTSLGSCTGSVTATIGLGAGAVDASLGYAPTVNESYAPYVFGAAECDCDTHDVYMRLQISQGLDAGTASSPTVWVGTSACSDYTTRTTTNQTQCQRYSPSNVNTLSFSAGSGNIGTSTFFDIAIPARALFSPNVGSCDITTASNDVFIFIGTDQTAPVATCTLNTTEQVTGPDPALNPVAASGDSAITVTWSSPTVGSLIPDSFQVLCADEDGNPVSSSPAAPAYSTCLAGGIRRRTDIFGASEVTTGSADAGTTSALDAGTSSTIRRPLSGGTPDAVDAGTTDAAVSGGTDGGTDMGPGTTLTSGIRVTNSGLPAPFTTLDPKYACTDRIVTNSSSYSPRITNLVNGKKYQFTVLSIDIYGNAVPTAIFTGIPQPVDDLYARYRDAGGTAHGFCFVATAAYGSYDQPQVRVLRAFRDTFLQANVIGRAFVRAYYATSPPLARFIAGSAFRRWVSRGVLWPLVGVASLALRLGSLSLALFIVGGVPALALWLRRRRLRRRASTEVFA